MRASPIAYRRCGRAVRPAGFAALLAIVLLAGCKPVGPNYNRPGFGAPPAYKETGASSVQVEIRGKLHAASVVKPPFVRHGKALIPI